MAQNMDTVFDAAKEFDNDFDTIFDKEDELIDTVVGCNEAGEPLTGVDFDDLHQVDSDDVNKKDFEQPDEDDGNKNAEGTKNEEIPDNADNEKETASDADKLLNDVEDDYQETDNSGKGVEDTVTGTIGNDNGIKTESADNDVEQMVNDEDDLDDELIDDVTDDETDLSYEISDEELIDAAINDDDI